MDSLTPKVSIGQCTFRVAQLAGKTNIKVARPKTEIEVVGVASSKVRPWFGQRCPRLGVQVSTNTFQISYLYRWWLGIKSRRCRRRRDIYPASADTNEKLYVRDPFPVGAGCSTVSQGAAASL